MKNLEVAKIFYEIADLLDIKGVPFKPRAYRRAAQTIETLTEDIQAIYERGELEKIPGVGVNIAAKIGEILETGRLGYLERLRSELPPGLRELMGIEGVGPKTALKLHKMLNVSSVDELELAIKEGKLRGLKGFREKTEENILQGIQMYRSAQKRFILGRILPTATEIKEQLEKLDVVGRIGLAGSIRRRKETIGDADILVTSKEPLKVMDFFTALPQVKRVLAKGKTKSTVILSNNLQVDLRVVKEESFGSALQYFTGSKQHNIRLRELALKRNWKLSEYSLFDKEKNEKIAGEDEKSIYEALELSYVEPELREDRGEIEAALERKLPKLVGYEEIRGDLHAHTVWSDGAHSILEMAEAAKSLGWEYLAVCDHSKTLRIAHGLKEEDLVKQMEEIEKINRKLEDFTVLAGVEVNIKSDGSLDIKNQVLKDLDIVVASVHSGFKHSKEQITERILDAVHNEYVNVLGHPTGRIIHRREPCQMDLQKVFEVAVAQKVFMEINAFPNRLDLSDIDCRRAKENGVKLTIGTDAHHKDHLRYMELGVATARRGWLESKDIINTLPVKGLKAALKK
ncbi:MAG: DNA polymerase/3'-5' exonuclease PolX [Thermoproteota archaeon]|nr:DNA polymerase/3'-5' exonuclease PolX [Thermoproteota archaeon]